MKKFIKYIAIPALAFGFVGCEIEFDEPVTEANFFENGEADFSNYVAIGNSLTAGFADSALYVTGQENSYPNIMATQFALVGGGDFNQPLMDDNLGGLLLGGQQIAQNRFVLAVDQNGNPGPAILAGSPTTDITNVLSENFNNMGVPGARSFDLLFPGYGNAANLPLANPYYARFSSGPNATVIGDAVAQNPSFFSLWIGNNDILGFATSGGSGVDQTGNLDPSTYSTNDITDPNLFANAYSQQVNALVATGAQGVLVNLPDVTSIPFFTTVPFTALSPLNPDFGAQITTLNETYAPLNAAFAFLGFPERAISFSETSASAVVIHDESLTDISESLTVALQAGGLDPLTAALFGGQYGQSRQAISSDLMVLTSAGVIGQLNTARFAELVSFGLPEATAGQLSVNGVSFPLEDQWVLTPEEQASITTAQTSYNATIEGLAAANGLALADAQGALRQVANGGTSFNGGVLTSTFVTGGAFSLDGVHPTPRGYALTANVILDAINAQYGSTIPSVDIGNFATITLSNDVN